MNQLMNTRAWSLVFAMGAMATMALVLGPVRAAAAQPAQPAQPADPAAVLLAWEKVAFGSTQDLDAALALMTDDAVVRVIPAAPGTTGNYTGKDAIWKSLQGARQLDVERQNVGSPRVEGNTVTTLSMVSNNFFRMWGVAPVEHLTEAIVEGGKIKSYTSTMSPAERPRVAAAAKAYQQAHPAQPAPGMPSTGGSPLVLIVAGLLTIGLLCLMAGALMRRLHSRV